MTITGAGFLAGGAVKVGGVVANSVSFVDGTHLTASTPLLVLATVNDGP